MRRGFDRRLNLDLFDDQWLWLQSTEPLIEEIPPWSDKEILHIYDCLLEDSLRNLFDGRSSMETVVEIYNWIMDSNAPNPFSFNNCCKLLGLDPDEIRETVFTRVNSINRRLH
jgi:hypothetical protein